MRKYAVYLKKRWHSRINGELTENERLNKAIVNKFPVPNFPNDLIGDYDLDSFHNQDVPAYMMSMQVKEILNFPFMRHIHTINKCLPGYRIQRAIIEAILRMNMSLVIGMCAYVLGAIPSELMEKTAREICRQCRRFYAVDFSSPSWRTEAFLNDTGKLGSAYLRAIHGKTKGWADTLSHPHIKYLTLSPGLASQYATWPGADDHSAGYTIREDGTLLPPNILSFAERMRRTHGKTVYYKSKVRLFSLLYLGYTVRGNVALASVPGRVADYLLAE